jgi:hypothetical protein|tara:strand:+ start:146 stop:1837 length:1692 start_codon:yes stop_codon:yes gene_type:complete
MQLTAKQEDAMRKDFRNFAHVIWMHLELPVLTAIQNDICHYLQHGGDRTQIVAFRGVGKSYVTAAYVCWLLWKDNELKIMIVSAGRDRADAFAIFCRNIIRDVPFLQHMEPDKSKGERATQNIFDVSGVKPSGSPSVKSVGITGQLTGSRADIIIADDIEVVSNSTTHDLREKLARLVTEFDAVIKPDSKIVYLGTPQTELSLYNTLYTKGYDMRIWCARIPTEQQANNYGAKLAPIIRKFMLTMKEGGSSDPLRFDDEDLAKRELSYGRSGFALQFMLDTSLSDGDKFPLKINDLIIGSLHGKLPEEVYWTNNPLNVIKDIPNVAMAGQKYYSPEKLSDERSSPQMTILSIDPSGRGKDETGYTVLQLLNGNIFCPKFGGLAGGYTDSTLGEIANIAKAYKVNKIIVESNFGDGMYTQLLKPHVSRIYPCEIEENHVTAQKELRIIDALEPVMNQHRLIFDQKTIQDDYDSARVSYSPDKAPQYMLFYQLSRLSKERGSLRHDDRLDALAQGVKFFLDYLDVDQEFQKNERKSESTDRMLDKFASEWMDENNGNQNNIRLWR